MTYGRNVQTLNGMCQTFSSRATFGTLPHKIGSVNNFFLTLAWPSDAVMFAALVLSLLEVETPALKNIGEHLEKYI